MQKIYSRTYWENFPSEKTAIDAMRLNNAEAGITNDSDTSEEENTDSQETDSTEE